MESPTTPTINIAVKAVNHFGFSLFRELTSTLDANIVISPISVSAALAMIYDGASGETRKAMAEALWLNEFRWDEEIDAPYGGLLGALTSPNMDMQLEIANSMWTRKGAALSAEYIERRRASFRAEIAEVEFNDATVQRINAWVSDKTQGKIASIIERLDPLSAMVLLNAVYFKAKWFDPFDSLATQDHLFTLQSGQQKLCPMMFRTEYYSYFQNEQIQAALLRYRGGRASMVVILPSQKLGLDGLLAQLSADQWNEWLDHLSERLSYVRFGLPRFKTVYDQNLNATLKALGMEPAFDPMRADFRTIAPKEQFYIGLVRHKTFLDVTEEGTEAGAATAVMYIRGIPPEPMVMIVDRPFFLAIRDDLTGALLFAGAIVDP